MNRMRAPGRGTVLLAAGIVSITIVPTAAPLANASAITPAGTSRSAAAVALPPQRGAPAGRHSGTLSVAGSVQPLTVEVRGAEPAYTCDRTYTGRKGKGWGWPNCSASGDAPQRGRIDGVFLIRPRNASDHTFRCKESPEENFPSGEAELPDRVLGFFCDPV